MRGSEIWHHTRLMPLSCGFQSHLRYQASKHKVCTEAVTLPPMSMGGSIPSAGTFAIEAGRDEDGNYRVGCEFMAHR